MPLVAKRDVVKSDLAPDRVGPAFPLGLPGFHRGVEQFEHPVAACQKAGEPGRELRQGGERGVEHRQVGKKRHERAERHLPGEHIAPADIPHNQPPQAEDEGHDGRERGIRVVDPHAGVAERFTGALKPLGLPRFLGKRLDHADAREHARNRSRLPTARIPVAVVNRVDPPPEVQAPCHHQRGGNEREESQLGVEGEQHQPHRHHLHNLQQKPPGHLLQQGVQHLAVVGHPADQ